MLNFLYVAVSWVLLRWHDLFTVLGFSDTSGIGWALSIVFLVITARLLLVRLFIKQVHYTRNMQKMQPKIQKLREKYKNDRAEMNRQMMALQQEEGFNPLSGCLPMLLQFPVFIGLYHTLRHLSNAAKVPKGATQSLCQRFDAHQKLSDAAHNLLNSYTFSPTETCHAAQSKIFNAPLAASFRDPGSVITDLGGHAGTTRIVLVILLIISSGATFGTQLLVRANAVSTPEGNAATIQKLMLYAIPLGTLASGLLFNFPLGVLLYWFTSNLWTLGQQAYIVRFHPHEPDPVTPVGQLGKTLAPKPGQKPSRRPTAAIVEDDDAEIPTSKSAAPGTNGSRSTGAGSTPKPGQKPNRPGQSNGKRPPAKRPTQSKKRR